LADWKSRLHEAVILLLKKRASIGDGKSPAAAPPTALISTRARLWLPRSGRAFGGMLEVAVAGGFAGLLGSARLFNAGGVRVEAAGGGVEEVMTQFQGCNGIVAVVALNKSVETIYRLSV
jgi:hypothetical protein